MDSESRKDFLILDERGTLDPGDTTILEACRGEKDLMAGIDSWHRQGVNGSVQHVDSGVILGSIEDIATADRKEQRREIRRFTGEG